MAIITIVGAGMMGSAMSIPATDNGHEVRLVGTPLDTDIITELKQTGYHKTLRRQLPPSVAYYTVEELDAALDRCDAVIGGVSSFGVQWFGEQVLPKLDKRVPVLSITKGLHADEGGKFIPFPDYLAGFPGCEGLSLNAVGGPCISFELADRHHTVVAFCGHDRGILAKLKELLATEYYHIHLTEDVMGLEMAVAMKNAYALGVSLAIGQTEAKYGEGAPEEYNPEAGLFAQSIRETARLLANCGGGADMILYSAGDLYVTVFGGRTRRIGTLLGRGLTYREAREILRGVTLESVAIAKLVIEALRRQGAELGSYPLLSHIYDMVENGATVQIPWSRFEE